MAFSADGEFLYVVTEMIPTVIAYKYDAARGTLAELGSWPLGEGFTEKDSGADIHTTADGYVYASLRGQDFIAVFKAQPDGALKYIGKSPSHGAIPRNFHIDPDGFAVIANQEGGNVVICPIGPDGLFGDVQCEIAIPKPVFVKAIRV